MDNTIKKNKKVTKTKQPKYKTKNGVQELPNGSYRIRKTINGVKYDGCFTNKRNAIKYLNLLMKESSNMNTTKAHLVR